MFEQSKMWSANLGIFCTSKTTLLKVQGVCTTPVHMQYIRENTLQDQEQGKSAQKSLKLEASKRVLTEIHSKRDLKEQNR